MYRQRNDNHAFDLLVNGASPPDPSLVLPGSEGFGSVTCLPLLLRGRFCTCTSCSGVDLGVLVDRKSYFDLVWCCVPCKFSGLMQLQASWMLCNQVVLPAPMGYWPWKFWGLQSELPHFSQSCNECKERKENLFLALLRIFILSQKIVVPSPAMYQLTIPFRDFVKRVVWNLSFTWLFTSALHKT